MQSDTNEIRVNEKRQSFMQIHARSIHSSTVMLIKWAKERDFFHTLVPTDQTPAVVMSQDSKTENVH